MESGFKGQPGSFLRKIAGGTIAGIARNRNGIAAGSGYLRIEAWLLLDVRGDDGDESYSVGRHFFLNDMDPSLPLGISEKDRFRAIPMRSRAIPAIPNGL